LWLAFLLFGFYQVGGYAVLCCQPRDRLGEYIRDEEGVEAVIVLHPWNKELYQIYIIPSFVPLVP
jgi:hypothetical protein